MKLTVLGSSSKGNSYVLSSATGSLLIEAGIPFKNIQEGLDFDLKDIAGCLITHEHKDHSKAVKEVTLAGIDCYMSMGTLKSMEYLNSHRLMPVISEMQFEINDFIILPFDTQHDCEQPLGYLIQYKPTKEKLLFLTDTYYCKYHFNKLSYIAIECNYIKETLDANIEAGYINEAMKPRLLQSHFSLENVKNFLKANDLSQCRKIILLHLSDSNSSAKRMIEEIEALTGIETVVADAGLELELEMYPY